MSKQRVFGYRRTVGLAMALVVTVVAAGCCSVTRRAGDEAVVDQAPTTDALPVLVTLAAEEGEALVAARERILALLRSTMSTDEFSAVRPYETLPIVALSATPEVVVLLLRHPDVRSLEADRSFSRP